MSVTLQSGESAIQLTVALNLAYFGFREIRSPAREKLKRLADDCVRTVDATVAKLALFEKPERPGPNDEATSLWFKRDWETATLLMHKSNITDRDYYSANAWLIESGLGNLALAAASFGFLLLAGLLIVGPVTLSGIVYGLLLALLLLPTILLVAYNLVIARMLDEDRRRVEAWSSEIDEIVKRVDEDYLPRWRKLQTAGRRP